MSLQVRVDSSRCISAGQCVLHAPDVFDQDDQDGTVILLQPHPSEDQREVVLEAVDACPASIITAEG